MQDTPRSAVRAILFDVDGTLADTEEGHRQAYNRAFAEFGLDWAWDVELYGRLLEVAGGKERMRHFLSDFYPGGLPPDADSLIPRVYTRKTELYTAMVRRGEIGLRPGIRKLLDHAESVGVRLAVATTTAHENVVALLDAQIGSQWPQLFAVLGCGDQVPRKKPAPDIYLWVLDRLGLGAADCIALEDSQLGLRAARAAGLRTWITRNAWTRNHSFEGAEAVYDDLSDLSRFCRSAGLPPPPPETPAPG